jgi:hypothetical protein
MVMSAWSKLWFPAASVTRRETLYVPGALRPYAKKGVCGPTSYPYTEPNP